jgi:hypothetical protein
VGVKDVPFDVLGDANGVLDTRIPGGFRTNPEVMAAQQDNLPLSPKVNLVLVRKIEAQLGATYPGTNRSFVQSFIFEGGTSYAFDDFLMTCVHEVGHQLGISTRDSTAGHDPTFGHHDQKYFPVRRYYRDGSRVPPPLRGKEPSPDDTPTRLYFGLMSQNTPPGEWKWIRHEDWKAANANARALEVP